MDDDDGLPSNASLIGQAWGFFPVAVNYLIIGAIFITAIVIGGQHLGFWLDTQNLQHQKNVQKLKNSIIQNSDNVQQGYVEAITTDVSTVNTYIIDASGSPNKAQDIAAAVGYGNQACLEASYLTGSFDVSAEMQTWINTNCSGGALTVNSPIRSGKGN